MPTSKYGSQTEQTLLNHFSIIQTFLGVALLDGISSLRIARSSDRYTGFGLYRQITGYEKGALKSPLPDKSPDIDGDSNSVQLPIWT